LRKISDLFYNVLCGNYIFTSLDINGEASGRGVPGGQEKGSMDNVRGDHTAGESSEHNQY
jgi:hypothetical protein